MLKVKTAEAGFEKPVHKYDKIGLEVRTNVYIVAQVLPIYYEWL